MAAVVRAAAASDESDSDADIVVAEASDSDADVAVAAAIVRAAAASDESDSDADIVVAEASDDSDADVVADMNASAAPWYDGAAVRRAAAACAGPAGYAVVDGVLAAAALAELAEDAPRAAYEAYAFRSDDGEQHAEPRVAEWLVDDWAAPTRLVRRLRAFGDAVAADARAAAPALGLDGHVAAKLGRQAAGGGLPAHFDNYGPPSKRGLTAVLYVSDAFRSDDDGGRLALYPFLRRPRRVAPRKNRLVLLRSDRVLHAVEPWRRAGAFRYACSFWFRSAAAGAPAPAPPRHFASHDAAATWFAASPRLRDVAPFVYDAAIARAARAAAAGAARAALLRSHAAARDAALRRFGAPLLAGLDARRAAVDARGGLGSDDDGDDGDDAPWERDE